MADLPDGRNPDSGWTALGHDIGTKDTSSDFEIGCFLSGSSVICFQTESGTFSYRLFNVYVMDGWILKKEYSL